MREATHAWLDTVGERALELVQRPGLAPAWEVLVALRPAWWVLRAWAAIGFALIVTGHEEDVAAVPEPGGDRALGLLVVAVAVVVSVQLGRRRIWPGTSNGVTARLLLLGLNVVAVVMLPVVVSELSTRREVVEAWEQSQYVYVEDPYVEQDHSGLSLGGAPVINIFPYDAKGNPLTGVQLFNENGERLDINREMATDVDETITYPWIGGGEELFNVFPLPVGPLDPDTWQRVRGVWSSSTPPELPTPPMPQAPQVSLPEVAAR